VPDPLDPTEICTLLPAEPPTLANGAGVARSWIGIFSRGDVLCAHNKCVEGASNPTNRIGGGYENERNRPRIDFPLVSVCGRGQRFSFNRKGSRLAEVRRGGSLWLEQF
jgi:hypothetical protein